MFSSQIVIVDGLWSSVLEVTPSHRNDTHFSTQIPILQVICFLHIIFLHGSFLTSPNKVFFMNDEIVVEGDVCSRTGSLFDSYML